MPQDSQVLAIAAKELDLKRQMLWQIEKMDEQDVSEMSKLSATMDKISDSIAAFSTILDSMVSPQLQPRPHASMNPLIFRGCLRQPLYYFHFDFRYVTLDIYIYIYIICVSMQVLQHLIYMQIYITLKQNGYFSRQRISFRSVTPP